MCRGMISGGLGDERERAPLDCEGGGALIRSPGLAGVFAPAAGGTM